MKSKSDAQLLREYARQGSDLAFGEIVARHTGLVYSAAVRQLHSPEMARDIAQSVFTDLARKAASVSDRLPANASLAGWVYKAARYAALNLLRAERRRQTQERQVMEQLSPEAEPATEWDRVCPVLDEAMAELGDADREAILLRFFQNEDFRAVGLAMGVSDDTAQKRVSRAVERLRESLAKRGVTVGAGALVAVIASNAVQAAPAGAILTISSAAALVPTAMSATEMAATKVIAMTALQKAAIIVGLAVAAGSGIYEARQAGRLRHQLAALRQEEGRQAEQWQRERDESATNLALLKAEVERQDRNTAELLRLRGEVARLRQQEAARPPTNSTVATARMQDQARPVEPGKYISKEQLAFAGYATPEACWQTFMWAALFGNYEAMTNSFSADGQKDFLDPNARKEFEQVMANEAASFKGTQILARKVISETEIELKIMTEEIQPDIGIESMVRVGADWKRRQSMGYTPEWEKDGVVQVFGP